MNKTISLIIVLVFLTVGLGCQNTKTKAVEGSVIGGVLGAAAGGIIGNQVGSAGAGAGIGAAVGAVAGGVIGSQIEKKPAEAGQATTTNATTNSQLSALQIIELSKQGTPDTVIIDKIQKTNSKFTLTSEDIAYLKKQGVSQKIIDTMQGK